MQFLTFDHLTDPVFTMLLVDGVLVSTKGFLVPSGALREKHQREALPCSFAGVQLRHNLSLVTLNLPLGHSEFFL